MTDKIILHIGAGTGAELADYLATDATRIVLVEPNPVLADSLRRRTAGEARVLVQELAITERPEHNQWVEYNLPDANSLAAPSALRQVFPGLRVVSKIPVATQTIAELINTLDITGDNNQLIIQAPGAERAVIQGLIKQGSLERFSTLRLTTNHEPYYEGSVQAGQLLAELKAQGYESQQIDSNLDWPQWELKSSPLNTKIKLLELEKDALTQKMAELQEDLKNHKNWLNNRKKELEEKDTRLAEAQKIAEAAEQRAQALEAQLNSNTNSQKEMAELKRRMEYLFEQNTLQLEQAANALGHHVSATAKTTARELEAGIALQQQYRGDLPALEGQNTKLSATVALAISRQLKTQPYDLIVEFGSGVTT
jgi:FkbM family methyltransferase